MEKTRYSLLLLAFILRAKAQIISTVAGNDTVGFSGDGGLAIHAKLNAPGGITFDSQGNLYVSDFYNDRIRMVNTSGIINTVAGGGTGGDGDGGIATQATLNRPFDVKFDAAGNMYIDDYLNVVIRKVDINGIINLYAGTYGYGYIGSGGDGGSAVNCYFSHQMFGIAVNNKGELYISDEGNSKIRRINATGIINAFASIKSSELAFDSEGNLYACCIDNRIRKIDTSGTISVIAGTGTAGFSGDNGLAINAEINNPDGIVADGVGNVYFSDGSNAVVRKIDTNGIITTIVGTGTSGYSGDGGSALQAEIGAGPLAFDALGNLYINSVSVIRKVTNVWQVGIKQTVVNEAQILVYPNPASAVIQVTANSGQLAGVKIYDVLGEEVRCEILDMRLDMAKLDISHLPNGIYFVQVKTAAGVSTQKIMIQHEN